MANKLFLTAVMFIVWYSLVDGRVTDTGPLLSDMEVMYEGVSREYCQFEDAQIFRDSSWTTFDCRRCTCNSNGLSCWIPESEVPDGCMRIYDFDCYERIVQSDNLDLDCSTNDVITGK
ncbi:hypothetical protein Bbelb_154800 [Branchiostoma belcheri]|nr:hypothetical protein Bbelb_154800 [Branchiostoma belcheri]